MKKDRCLADIFGAPPLSVLDPKQKYWKTKKKVWLEKGIESELGRKENALGLSKLLQKKQKGTSIFDPFLTELIIRWYSKEGDLVFDPFAGGSVRGIVTSSLGRRYIGYELREEQVASNNLQKHISTNPDFIQWVQGDSLQLLSSDKEEEEGKGKTKYQLIFTCPPYMDMETYSNDPRDLSTMKTDDFFSVYEKILRKAVENLDEDCFFVIMVGNVRKNGSLVCFPETTVKILLDLGLNYHNELIYLQEPATAAMRAFNAMNSTRVAGSVHQKIYVFCKGSSKQAAIRLGQFSD